MVIGSLRDREKLPAGSAKTVKVIPPAMPMTHLPIEGQRRSSSIRDKSGRVLPTSPLAAGILRQQSVATPTGSFVHRTVIPHAGSSSTAASSGLDHSEGGGGGHSSDSDASRYVSPLGAKAKPRLTRQIAFQEEVAGAGAGGGGGQQCGSSGSNKCVSFNTANVVVLPNKEEQRNYCPLHSPRLLQGVWESSIEEDYEEIDDPVDDVAKVSKSHNKAKEPKKSYIGNEELLAAVASIYNNRDKNRLGLAGFIPRKLSTISSRSCSVNPDNDGAADPANGNEIVNQVDQLPSSVSQEVTPSTQHFSDSVTKPTTSQETNVKSSKELLNVIGYSGATASNASQSMTGVKETKTVAERHQLSKSDHDLYHKYQPKSCRPSIGSIVRFIVTPETSTLTSVRTATLQPRKPTRASTSEISSSSIQVAESSFGGTDIHPSRQPDDRHLVIQSPESRELEGSVKGNQKQLDNTSELDPLMQ